MPILKSLMSLLNYLIITMISISFVNVYLLNPINFKLMKILKFIIYSLNIKIFLKYFFNYVKNTKRLFTLVT